MLTGDLSVRTKPWSFDRRIRAGGVEVAQPMITNRPALSALDHISPTRTTAARLSGIISRFD
jgi:hypothetical protein